MANVANQPAQTGLAVSSTQNVSSTMVLGSDAYRGALEPTTMETAWQLAETMASIAFCGVTSAAEALGRIMTGRGIGLSAMQSMRGVYTINGRPGLDASLMHALCLSSPLCDRFAFVPEESDDTKATFVAQRKGDAPVKHTFTLEQAKDMGVLDRNNDDPDKKKKDVWQTQRAAMLRARCKAELARLVFPDLTFGMYSREEFDAGLVEPSAVGRKDPNELAAEILSAEEAAAEAAAGKVTSIQAAKRDYAGEAEALKQKIIAAGSSRAARAEVRKELELWDGIEPYKSQVSKVYNDTRVTKAATADSNTAAASTAGAAPVPETNLFTGTKEEGK